MDCEIKEVVIKKIQIELTEEEFLLLVNGLGAVSPSSLRVAGMQEKESRFYCDLYPKFSALRNKILDNRTKSL